MAVEVIGENTKPTLFSMKNILMTDIFSRAFAQGAERV